MIKTHQLKLYGSSALVYSVGYLLVRLEALPHLVYRLEWLVLKIAGLILDKYQNIVPMYRNVLTDQTYTYLLYMLVIFLFVSPIYYSEVKNEEAVNKPLLFLRSLKKIVTKKWNEITKDEKIAARFLLVKIFFIPLMMQFFMGNFEWLRWRGGATAIFATVLTLIFTIDTGVFLVSYLFEFEFLKNKVKSVEPTLLGWLVALICYPPFNGITSKFVPWGSDEYAYFWTPEITNILRVIIVILFAIYLAATISLGTKASNLTNRGIVWRFPYSIVRHPAYISKNLVWWIGLSPIVIKNFQQGNNWTAVTFIAGMTFWSIIYILRAYTEEKHLELDPEYLEYRKKVKWKFIPWVW